MVSKKRKSSWQTNSGLQQNSPHIEGTTSCFILSQSNWMNQNDELFDRKALETSKEPLWCSVWKRGTVQHLGFLQIRHRLLTGFKVWLQHDRKSHQSIHVHCMDRLSFTRVFPHFAGKCPKGLTVRFICLQTRKETGHIFTFGVSCVQGSNDGRNPNLYLKSPRLVGCMFYLVTCQSWLVHKRNKPAWLMLKSQKYL